MGLNELQRVLRHYVKTSHMVVPLGPYRCYYCVCVRGGVSCMLVLLLPTETVCWSAFLTGSFSNNDISINAILTSYLINICTDVEKICVVTTFTD
jgi:hypothetical protein